MVVSDKIFLDFILFSPYNLREFKRFLALVLLEFKQKITCEVACVWLSTVTQKV